MTSKSSTVEVVLVLEITPCPLTDMTRDSKDNFQDKGLNHVLKYELLTAYLLSSLSSSFLLSAPAPGHFPSSSL